MRKPVFGVSDQVRHKEADLHLFFAYAKIWFSHEATHFVVCFPGALRLDSEFRNLRYLNFPKFWDTKKAVNHPKT